MGVVRSEDLKDDISGRGNFRRKNYVVSSHALIPSQKDITGEVVQDIKKKHLAEIGKAEVEPETDIPGLEDENEVLEPELETDTPAEPETDPEEDEIPEVLRGEGRRARRKKG